jgi:cobalt-precorrin 5A hydrolase
MKAAVLVLTEQGLKTAQRIIAQWPEAEPPQLWIHKKEVEKEAEELFFSFNELKAVVPQLWEKCSLLIFIMAAGIVVRQIAPLLQSKDRDPAVLVLDEKGGFLIPLLSGHLGGANAWAKEVAQRIGAKPVLTTATDINGLVAPDEYARQFGWAVEPVEGLRKVNRFLLDQGYLNVWSDYELPENHPLQQDPHYRFLTESEKVKAHLWISFHQSNLDETPLADIGMIPQSRPLQLIPRVFSVGVGCRRNTSYERILEAIQGCLDQLGVSHKSIQGIYSIDLKADELGIQEVAQILRVPFRTFTAQEVQAVNEEQGLTYSRYVRQKIGVDGVCEAASVLGTKQGELILPKQKRNGVTVAISQEKLLL